jgi:hypothetical protein
MIQNMPKSKRSVRSQFKRGEFNMPTVGKTGMTNCETKKGKEGNFDKIGRCQPNERRKPFRTPKPGGSKPAYEQHYGKDLFHGRGGGLFYFNKNGKRVYISKKARVKHGYKTQSGEKIY